MSVKIRLKRMGMKKKPFYRLVVADVRSPRDGRFIEEIGYYNPMTAPAEVKVDGERAKYWLGVGAQPTDTVKVLLKKTGVIEKCRFCWYEGEPGNPPRCVGTCISGARLFGDLDDPQSEICQEIARTNAQPLAGDLTTAKIYYVR